MKIKTFFLFLIFSAVGIPAQLWASHTGEVEVMISDDFENKTSQYHYSLKTSDGKHYDLDFGGSKPPISSGDTITVRGHQYKGVIAVPYSTDKNSLQILISRPSKPIDPFIRTKKEVAVILFNFLNDTSQPFTPDYVRESVFTGAQSANAFYQEQSFDQVFFAGKIRSDGDVFGPYTINHNNNQGCPKVLWREAANEAAQAAGVDLAGYDNFIYVFPRTNSCNWSGWGAYKGKNSMINGNPTPPVISHELGHNFGVNHANSYHCVDPNTQQPTPIAPPSNCYSTEYGDPFSVMGGSYRRRFSHMNAFHKGQGGYLLPDNVLTFSTDGTYFIEPIEKKLFRSIQSIVIPRNLTTSNEETRNYYLEYRQPYGFDNFDPQESVVNGLSIRVGPNHESEWIPSNLIDTTPETDIENAALGVGKSLYTYDGFKIKLLDKTNEGATVRIDRINEPTAPVFGNILVRGITPTSAEINWAVHERGFGTAQVEYGPTTSYGNSTALNPEFQGVHLQKLSNLSPNTLYHYRVESRGENGQLAVSEDYTFTTAILPSEITIISPQDRSWVSGQRKVFIDISNNNSAHDVKLLLDDSLFFWRFVSISANYAVLFNTTLLSDGPHVLRANVEYSGGSNSHSISIYVDNTAPVVSFSSPANGITVPGTGVAISANASDGSGVGVVGVQFYLDDSPLGTEDRETPYSISWDFSNVVHGPHTLKAIARDFHGNVSAPSLITVNVNNPEIIPPTVVFTYPVLEMGTVGGLVPISADASDNRGVAGVQFYLSEYMSGLNRFSLGAEDTTAPYSLSWDSTLVAGGHYILEAVVRDTSGNTNSNSIPIHVDNSDTTPPTLSITSPVNGAVVSEDIDLSGTAGGPHSLLKVEVQIDNGAFNRATGLASWTYPLNSSTISNGDHVITVKATNTRGNAQTTSIWVRMNIPVNLVSNSGFESGKAGWYFYPRMAVVDSEVFHSGNKSAKVSAPRYSNYLIRRRSFIFGIVPNKAYKASVWIKLSNVVARDNLYGVQAVLRWYSSDGKPLGSHVIINKLTGTMDWTKFSKTFIAPQNSAGARFILQHRISSGTAWFDDVALNVQEASGALGAPLSFQMNSNDNLSAEVLEDFDELDDPVIEEEKILADQGGEVTSIKNHKVVVPPHALAGDTDISIESLEEPDPQEEAIRTAKREAQNLKAVSEPVEFGPHGTQFNAPVTLTLAYDPALLEGRSEKDLTIAYWNEDTFAWELLPSVVDKGNKTISAQTMHFSLYQVFAKPSSHIDPFFKRGSIYSFPNPSVNGKNPTIHVECGVANTVEIRVYNEIGELVHEANLSESPGVKDDTYFYEYVWDVSGVASGTYVYIVTAKKSGEADIQAKGKLAVIR